MAPPKNLRQNKVAAAAAAAATARQKDAYLKQLAETREKVELLERLAGLQKEEVKIDSAPAPSPSLNGKFMNNIVDTYCQNLFSHC